MWRKILDKIGHGKSRTQIPEALLLAPEENPWGVPVLDIRPITSVTTSFSQDPVTAANAMSYGQEDGTCFIGQSPSQSDRFHTPLKYKTNGRLYPGMLFAPRAMEHKWAVYFHDDKILLIRSWLREVHLLAETTQTEGLLSIDYINGVFGDIVEPEMCIRIFDFILQSHALGLTIPAPLPKGMLSDRGSAALWCISLYGSIASFASEAHLGRELPPQPLCSHSLLHIALARGEHTRVKELVHSHWPIDLLSGDGLTTMHWATARPNMEMVKLLLAMGADIDMRSAQGATALMNTVQSEELEKMIYLLQQGANPNAKDNRGFTALHRAAEMNLPRMVEVLLSHGAHSVEAEGHTPESLALARGNKAVTQLLSR